MLTVVILGFTAGVFSEIIYRGYLSYEIWSKAAFGYGVDKGEFLVAFGYPGHVIYDKDAGYHYNSDPYYSINHYVDKKYTCSVSNNFGKHTLRKDISDYESADYKILLLGSSYAGYRFPDGSGTLINHTTKSLEHEYQGTFGGINLSRGSTGMLEMADLAVSVIPKEFQPDLVLFTLNTSDVARPRWWPIYRDVGEGMYRWYQSREAEPKSFTRELVITQSAVLSAEIDQEWCDYINNLFQTKGIEEVQEDPLAQKIVRHISAAKAIQRRPHFDVNPFTEPVCFICDKIKHGSAYYSISVFNQNNPISQVKPDKFKNDQQFIQNFAKFKELGIPYFIMHFPSYAEFKYNTRAAYGHYGMGAQENEDIFNILQELTGAEVVWLKDYISLGELQPHEFVSHEKDWHPQLMGSELLAKAMHDVIAEYLEKNDIVQKTGNKFSGRYTQCTETSVTPTPSTAGKDISCP